MPLVATILVFVSVGAVFLLANLVVGRLVRPAHPSPEKGEVYECGEQPIGSAWIQFDLRFYVVALLFVIFDVEIAFFFPWAVVFGSANQLADPYLLTSERDAIEQRLRFSDAPPRRIDPFEHVDSLKHAPERRVQYVEEARAAHDFAQFAFLELLVFFGVLLVGFAYLWRRGDLEWVRSIAGQIRPDTVGYGPPSPGMEK